MTTNNAKKAKPAYVPGVAARNIMAIWTSVRSANTSTPGSALQSLSVKDHYCADRATD